MAGRRIRIGERSDVRFGRAAVAGLLLIGLTIVGEGAEQTAGDAARDCDRFTSLFLTEGPGDGVERDTLLDGLVEGGSEGADDRDPDNRLYQAFLPLAGVEGGSMDNEEGLPA